MTPPPSGPRDGARGVEIRPVRRALVPVDAAAAERVSARNYDEFQSDLEVHEAIASRPDCILRVTMAHCAVDAPEAILAQDSPDALELAAENLRRLEASGLVRQVQDILYVYEIQDRHRPGVRQIGLGGMAPTADIRTESTPAGNIVRNEGIREEKARGRADLIRRTGAFIGTVNHAVEDPNGRFQEALARHAEAGPADFQATDERGCAHHVRLIRESGPIDELRRALAAEPRAYVADGNHRSAAAAMLGLEGYLGVFFPAATMGLAPYNRLVKRPRIALAELIPMLRENFEIAPLPGVEAFQPSTKHQIGLYAEGVWHRLTPKPGSHDQRSPVESIDADIVQRTFFAHVLGITDPRDERLTFVGGDRDALYLSERVDAGEFAYAVSLPPVSLEQFIDVCRAEQIMPPKSTWFQPKLRMGLVVAMV